jgi:hypothetical protein
VGAISYSNGLNYFRVFPPLALHFGDLCGLLGSEERLIAHI